MLFCSSSECCAKHPEKPFAQKLTNQVRFTWLMTHNWNTALQLFRRDWTCSVDWSIQARILQKYWLYIANGDLQCSFKPIEQHIVFIKSLKTTEFSWVLRKLKNSPGLSLYFIRSKGKNAQNDFKMTWPGINSHLKCCICWVTRQPSGILWFIWNKRCDKPGVPASSWEPGLSTVTPSHRNPLCPTRPVKHL